MKLKISVSKQDIIKAAPCSGHNRSMAKDCPIRLAIDNIFPDAVVFAKKIFTDSETLALITLPPVAQRFIHRFDNSSHEKRAAMKPFEFEIEIGDEIISKINIDNERQYFNTKSSVVAS